MQRESKKSIILIEKKTFWGLCSEIIQRRYIVSTVIDEMLRKNKDNETDKAM